MVLVARGRMGAATVTLVGGVLAWWLVIVGTIALVFPTPEIVSNPAIVAFAPGHRAYVLVPSEGVWLIPIDRVTFYEVDRAVRDDSDAALSRGRHRQRRRLVIVSGTMRIPACL